MFFIRFLRKFSAKSVTRTFSSDAKGETTALYNFHVENGGKIVNFGGFMLPVQYNDLSIVNSHLFTRRSASLFDVSHMLQTEIRGQKCIEYLETTCTADIQGLQKNTATLTVFTNKKGGILDDLIVTKIADDHLYIVSNAARKQHDRQLMLEALVIKSQFIILNQKMVARVRQKHTPAGITFLLSKDDDTYKKKNGDTDIKIQFFEPSERSLLALQGPKAAEALKRLTEVELSSLYFMTTTTGSVADIKGCRITRCGYTGEDGFEISIPSSETARVAKALLDDDNVKLAGLGARDSLRLEAGLCLYGNDITEETTPIEAALTWLVAKRRRDLKNFPGADNILKQIKEKSPTKRIGLISSSGPPARQGAVILSKEGQELGTVTSGCPSPSLGKNIAMGYVPTSHSKIGTNVNLKIRDKVYEAVITKMPFVKSNYYNKPK